MAHKKCTIGMPEELGGMPDPFEGRVELDRKMAKADSSRVMVRNVIQGKAENATLEELKSAARYLCIGISTKDTKETIMKSIEKRVDVLPRHIQMMIMM